MAKCIRCGEEIEKANDVRYLQFVDVNRNWCIRTEQMKPICELCMSEISSFATETVTRKRAYRKKVGDVVLEGENEE